MLEKKLIATKFFFRWLGVNWKCNPHVFNDYLLFFSRTEIIYVHLTRAISCLAYIFKVRNINDLVGIAIEQYVEKKNV